MTDHTEWETCTPGDFAAKLLPIIHSRLANCVVHADIQRLQTEVTVSPQLVIVTGR